MKKKLKKETIERLNYIKNIYDSCNTLQETAEKVGLTRERVRQLLRKGEMFGLFKYELHRNTKYEEIINKYDRATLVEIIHSKKSFNRICETLNIKSNILSKLLKHYGIDYESHLNDSKKEKILGEYSEIVDALGHHPSTTEMSQRKKWRNLWMKIDRRWGNMNNFRKEYGILTPR